MHVELYERIWMWAATGVLVLFLGTIVVTAANNAIQPPSHMETIDPQNARQQSGVQQSRGEGAVRMAAWS